MIRRLTLFDSVVISPPAIEWPPCPDDRTSFAAYRASLQCRMKFAFPESELRNMYDANSDGSVGPPKAPGRIHEAIGSGEIKRDYSNIRVPVLALFEFPRTPPDRLRPGDPQPRSDEERAAVLAFATATKAFIDRWVANLKRGVPSARLVDLPAAGHYVFITREADVLREIRAFVAGLPARR
jgi:non-heme chloroperoxidase